MFTVDRPDKNTGVSLSDYVTYVCSNHLAHMSVPARNKSYARSLTRFFSRGLHHIDVVFHFRWHTSDLAIWHTCCRELHWKRAF